MSTQLLGEINRKLDLLLAALPARPDETRYLNAEAVSRLTGLDKRTILNRSALDPKDDRFIPSLRFGGSSRKYFERKVIERLFRIG